MSEQNKNSAFWTKTNELLEKGNRNRFTVIRKEKKVFSISITLFLVLLVLFCPATLIAMLVGLFAGCRYHFGGEDIPADNQLNQLFSKLSESVDVETNQDNQTK